VNEQLALLKTDIAVLNRKVDLLLEAQKRAFDMEMMYADRMKAREPLVFNIVSEVCTWFSAQLWKFKN
jgi:hypothetical protein